MPPVKTYLKNRMDRYFLKTGRWQAVDEVYNEIR